MLPLSHIFVATEVTKRKAPLLVFGSVLPDVSWTSKSEIGRDQIHYAPRELYEYIHKNNPELIDFALGVKLHSNVDKGADYYSDDTETGFAKVEGRKIEDDVSKLLDEEKGERTLVTAHSLIEVSVDMLLNKAKPEILSLYKDSIKEINFPEISLCLSHYLNLTQQTVSSEIASFLNFVGPEAYLSKETLLDKLIILLSQRRGKKVDRKETERILEKAIGIMKNKYVNYLENAINNIKTDFTEFI